MGVVVAFQHGTNASVRSCHSPHKNQGDKFAYGLEDDVPLAQKQIAQSRRCPPRLLIITARRQVTSSAAAAAPIRSASV